MVKKRHKRRLRQLYSVLIFALSLAAIGSFALYYWREVFNGFVYSDF